MKIFSVRFLGAVLLILFVAVSFLSAQTGDVSQPIVKKSIYNDTSIPLRDMVDIPVTPIPWQDGIIPLQEIPRAYQQYERDPVLQLTDGENSGGTIIENFDGVPVGTPFSVAPPDPSMDVGPNHVMQMVNLGYQIWDKSGNSLFGPVSNGSIWAGFPGPWATSLNDGDPIVLYDQLADRWFASQFSLPNGGAGPEYILIAISTTPDPTGAWHRYGFVFPEFPDYPHYGVWPDGYYMSVNRFAPGFTGTYAAAFERDMMLVGAPAQYVFFANPTSVGDSFLPSDWDGTITPPAGAPNYFTAAGFNSLRIYEFHVDWVTPANSTFIGPLVISTSPFSFINNIQQLGTTTTLDGVSPRLMNRSQYRNFGTHQSMVTSHSIDAGGSRAGMRWYELRNTGGGWTMFQQGTYAPVDGQERWMGSVAMNGKGDIALGYTVSSTTINPQIRYTGRQAGDPLGTMTITEGTIIAGGGSQTGGLTRWGDYSQMSVDPVDDQTFWYTHEYIPSNGSFNWRTRIASINFGGGVLPADISVSPTSFTFNVPLNGSDTDVLTISNVAPAGSQNLNWNIFEQELPLVMNDGTILSVKVQPHQEARKTFQPVPKGDITGTASRNDVEIRQIEFIPSDGPASTVVIETGIFITNSILQALNELSVAYDFIATSDFTTIDFTPYNTIILGMDGGLVSEVSVQTVANEAASGKKLIIFGGTNISSYYNGVMLYLLQHSGVQGWTISSTPHLTVTDPTHPLASGLPSTYNYVNSSAAWYMLRSTDPAAVIAAQNGDGFPALINKPIGSGMLIYSISSPADGYYGDPGDYAILKTIINNAINFSTDCPWLSENPTNGTIPAGSNQNVDIMVDATGLAAGTYNCNLAVNSNDPDEPTVIVPVQLNVGVGGCSGTAIGSALCNNAQQGTSTTVGIEVNMSGINPPDHLLGSFTATLDYDPSLLDFTGHSGLQSGFTGVVNVNEAAGLITFNGANPTGAGGNVSLLDINFDVIGPVGNTFILDLEFSAMASALTFTDLLPCLTVNDCSFTILPPGFLGDVNEDDNCNSTDALIILSYDVGIPIPQEFLDRINEGYGDVNCDGLTNSTDALILLSYDVGIPVPQYPICEPFVPCTPATVYKEPTKSVGGNIGVTANPVTADIKRGMTVEIPVNIDVSAFDLKLGSFTATLEWDNTTMVFESFEGGRTNGFEAPTVNAKETDKGKLVFSSAVPEGAKGRVNVLNLKLKVIGKSGVSSALKLSFTSMAAAKTFENLLPYLDSQEIISNIVSIGNNPTKFKLENYPNPFNPTTKISYSLPVAGAVKIVIYNTLGQQVRVLVNQEQDAGQYSIEWDSRNDHNQTLSSGVYILRMQAEGFVKDKKLLLLK